MTAPEPLLFLNFNQSQSGRAGLHALDRDYILACRFLRCSIIDRTRSLALPFSYLVLDQIPARAQNLPSFRELCDWTAGSIIEESMRTGKRISLLWSGGIDSTAALIALFRLAETAAYNRPIRVVLSTRSVEENPRFFLEHVRQRCEIAVVSHPIFNALNPADLNVTGEHGDQLFGSHLLEPYVRRGMGNAAYEDVVPLVLFERLKSVRSAHRVLRYLAPLIASAPVPVRTLFDYFWWCNFALKWQEVTLRLAVMRANEASAVYDSLRHFFRNDRFQQWALATTPGRTIPIWSRYKDDAKRYIFDFTGDLTYYLHKEKEDSLRHVMAGSDPAARLSAYMPDDFRPVFQVASACTRAGPSYPGDIRSAIRRRFQIRDNRSVVDIAHAPSRSFGEER